MTRESRLRAIWGILASGLVIGVCVAAFNTAEHFFDGLCGSTMVQTIPSPDGELKAVVFEHDCGATTGYSTQVSILRRGETLTKKASDTFVAEGQMPIVVTWTAPRDLTIATLGSRVFRREKRSIDGVRITYK